MRHLQYFSNFVHEGLTVKNGNFEFDAKDNKLINTAINIEFKKHIKLYKRTLTVSQVPAYHVYNRGSSDKITPIIKTIKNSQFDEKDSVLDLFLRRTTALIYSALKKQSIDTILITPSTSKLNSVLANLLKNYFLGKKPDILETNIRKNFENVKLTDNVKTLKPETQEAIQKMYDKLKNNKIKIKGIKSQFRKFFYNFIEIDKKIKNKIINKNILIIDDYFNTGLTLDQISIETLKLSPKNIICLSIFGNVVGTNTKRFSISNLEKPKPLTYSDNSFDKFYTDDTAAKYFVEKTLEVLKNHGYTISDIIEPSAGNGSILKHIPKEYKVHAYDIKPEKKGIKTQDFLNIKRTVSKNPLTEYKKNRLTITNPPFGRSNMLSYNFIKQASKIGDFIAVIQPINQLDKMPELENIALIHSESLGKVDFSGKILPVCFNVFVVSDAIYTTPKKYYINILKKSLD